MEKNINKIVLAYSGGLDTSVILKWLQEKYKCEVITFTADIGQGVEVEEARAKAKQMGVSEIFIEDLNETFVRDYVFPMFRANALYEGIYLLGTSIARPLIAKRQIEIAHKVGANSVAHGATGKGNDQIRFELGYYANDPDINIIAPWRIWELTSREELIKFAQRNNIHVPMDKMNTPPYSMDANLLHTSYEGKSLEDPEKNADSMIYNRSVSPKEAPDKQTEISIEFSKGDPVAINEEKLSPKSLLQKLNVVGGKNGIGRIDIVENRFIGMKSRGVYETPGGTISFEYKLFLDSLPNTSTFPLYKESLTIPSTKI